MCYGFSNPCNKANSVQISLSISNTLPHYKAKQAILKTNHRKYKFDVSPNFGNKTTCQMFAYVRYLVLDSPELDQIELDKQIDLKNLFKPENRSLIPNFNGFLPPLSLSNEIDSWQYLCKLIT